MFFFLWCRACRTRAKEPNEDVRRAFYAAANYYAADVLASSPQTAGKIVVCDRFFNSTLAYHLAHGTQPLPAPGDPVYDWPQDLRPAPTASVLLVLPETARASRVISRAASGAEQVVTKKKKKKKKKKGK